MTYHIKDIEDVKPIGLKKNVVGLESGKYMDISFLYNFRCDSDLRIGEAACRRVSCSCLTYLEILKKSMEYRSRRQRATMIRGH